MTARFTVVYDDIVADVAPQRGDIIADFKGVVGLGPASHDQAEAVILLHDTLLSQQAALIGCDVTLASDRPASDMEHRRLIIPKLAAGHWSIIPLFDAWHKYALSIRRVYPALRRRQPHVEKDQSVDPFPAREDFPMQMRRAAAARVAAQADDLPGFDALAHRDM